MPRAREGERAVAPVVDGDDGGGELPVGRIAGERLARGVQHRARLETPLETRAQLVAHRRRARDRVAIVTGDVAEDDRGAILVEREGVVEVTPRPAPGGGPC